MPLYNRQMIDYLFCPRRHVITRDDETKYDNTVHRLRLGGEGTVHKATVPKLDQAA